MKAIVVTDQTAGISFILMKVRNRLEFLYARSL